MPVSKKKSEAPWEDAAKTTVKANKTISAKKSEKFSVILQAFGVDTKVNFDSIVERDAAIKSISVRCARGTTATITGCGKKYTVIPNLGVIISDEA